MPQTKLYRERKLKYNGLKSIYYNKSCFKNLYKQIKDLLHNEHVEEDFNLNMFAFLKHMIKLKAFLINSLTIIKNYNFGAFQKKEFRNKLF